MSKRPYWQHTPCPEWCHGRHGKKDGGSDRGCMSKWVSETNEKGITYLEFTPGEALKLIKTLTTAVAIAEGNASPGGGTQ